MGLLDQYMAKTGGLLTELPPDDQLANMKWQDLYNLRERASGNPKFQEKLAPFEHQAYARETVADNPIAAPVWAVLPAGYQALKLLGGGNHDAMSTPASLDQALAGFRGVGQGVSQAFGKYFK